MSTWGKIARLLSLLIGILYVALVVAPLLAHGKSAPEICVVSLEYAVIIALPVALIWFPEQIGAATGFIGHSVVNAETPPFLVALMGWVFLAGMPVLYYALR